MPLSPAEKKRHTQFVEASKILRDNGHDDLADNTVDYMLAGRGAAFAKRLADEARGMKSNLSIKLDGALWDEITPRLHVNDDDPTKSLRDSDDNTLAAIVEDGLKEFLDGTFDVHLSGRQARGSAASSRLTVSVGSSLTGAVSTRCRELRERKTSPGRGLFQSTVAAHAIYRHFQVGPYAPDAGA